MRTREPKSSRSWLWLGCWLALSSVASAAPQVDYVRDVRPLLSDNCYACHGPDVRKVKGGLRLDLRDVVIAPLESGEIAIVPGKPDESELVRRIFAADPDDRMPPADSHKSLTLAQQELLKRWISEGAVYRAHWAYERPKKPSVPQGVNAIDFLVRSKLEERGLKPSSEADRRTLARRLHLDLVGLPPKPEDVDAFEKDDSSAAYERIVDRLMASPSYGEVMSIGWLDVVRFADTIGYHSDNPRNVWPYRDYVIRAFNDNKPFDRFTREQLAGDLLPDATQEQRVASGFNRLIQTTEEGGAQPPDYESRHLGDRVRSVSTVWMAQTMGCAQCHDHKFDPIKARDFYSLGAFFADVKEAPTGPREAGMFLANEAQMRELSRHAQETDGLQQEFDAPHPELMEAFASWQVTRLAELEIEEAKRAASPQQAPLEDEANVDELEKQPGFMGTPKSLEQALLEILRTPEAERSKKQRNKLYGYFKGLTPQLADLRARLKKAKDARAAFEAGVPRTLVTVALPEPRTVRILSRGDWMDETGEIVSPALPAYLVAAGGQDPERRLNRLDLANWLVSRDNPLTARVVMNRLWKQFFGVGLSRVLEDFGTRGEQPSNQPLLDWLACEFVDSGWDLKHMVRLIVTSETYRQTSNAARELAELDPDNRLLARQSRWRLDAEIVRDNALSLAGLLDPTIGGPSAKPYQPSGYWDNLNFPARTYDASAGASQYRRGLYTWWQRSFLHPSLAAFDAPSREECAPERARSNIPQQALALLNDPSYVEAARAFGARALHECSGDDAARIRWAWRQALAREPSREEVAILRELLDKQRAQYLADRPAALKLVSVGNSARPSDVEPTELAAWTNVARAILNLHETITRS